MRFRDGGRREWQWPDGSFQEIPPPVGPDAGHVGYSIDRPIIIDDPVRRVRAGDRVTVTVLGERVPATVTEGYTALGNVEVDLDMPITVGEVAIRRVTRGPADVRALRPDPGWRR